MALKLEEDVKLELSNRSPPGTRDGSDVEGPKSELLLISLCDGGDDGSCGLVRLKLSRSPIPDRYAGYAGGKLHQK